MYLLCNEPVFFQEPHLAIDLFVKCVQDCGKLGRIHVWSDGLQNTHKGPHSLCPNFSVKIETFASAWLQWVWRTEGHFVCLVCVIWTNVKVWEAFCQTNWSPHRTIVGSAILDWFSASICTEDWRLPIVTANVTAAIFRMNCHTFGNVRKSLLLFVAQARRGF